MATILFLLLILLPLFEVTAMSKSNSEPHHEGIPDAIFNFISPGDFVTGKVIDIPPELLVSSYTTGFTSVDLNKVYYYGPSLNPPYSIKLVFNKINKIFFNNTVSDGSTDATKIDVIDRHLQKQKQKSLSYLDSVINRIYSFVQNNKVSLKTKANARLYSGEDGELNGPGFDFYKENLPTKIAWASYCFGIDPFMFASLIKKESKFHVNAVSTTGAFGLTQMTESGFTEVNEQLGLLGEGFHSPNAPNILEKQIQCYLAGEKVWTPFWLDKRFLNKQKIKVREKNSLSDFEFGKQFYMIRGKGAKATRKWLFNKSFKLWLKEDPDRQIIYGAILFKIYLNGGNYIKALKNYNADGMKKANKYAQDVVRDYELLRKQTKLTINQDNDENLFPVSNKQDAEALNEDSNGNNPISYFAFKSGDKNCLIEMSIINDDSIINDYLSLLFSTESKDNNSNLSLEKIRESIIMNEAKCRSDHLSI